MPVFRGAETRVELPALGDNASVVGVQRIGTVVMHFGIVPALLGYGDLAQNPMHLDIVLIERKPLTNTVHRLVVQP